MTAIGAPRRGVRLGLRGRTDLRLLVGLVLFLLTFAGAYAGWQAMRTTTPVLVAARDLPAGRRLAGDDLAVADVHLPAGQLALAVLDADRGRVVGRTLTAPVVAGELLVTARLGDGPALGPDDAAVTVAVRADSVYPRLRPGDAVSVLATRDRGKPTSQTTTLLARATVYAVAAESSTASLSSTGEDGDTAPRRVTNVTLLIPRTEAEGLAHAAVNWDLTLALLPAAQRGP